MNIIGSVEDLENELEQAHPGLPSHAYQSIAQEAQSRSTGGSGGQEWAFTTCKLAWLEIKQEPAADNMDVECFS